MREEPWWWREQTPERIQVPARVADEVLEGHECQHDLTYCLLAVAYLVLLAVMLVHRRRVRRPGKMALRAQE